LAQVFPQWANRVPLILGVGAVVFALFATFGIWYWFSPSFTDAGYRPEQPVPFSHKLHAGDLQVSCLYCHGNVERAAVASVPSTQMCMNCHSLVARDKASLEPVRASASSGQPLMWVRVHKIPDYAYFPHAPHLRAGVGCSSCHGNVKAMERIQQAEPLSMGWCLECHRRPEPNLRPLEEVTNMEWKPAGDPVETGKLLAERNHVHTRTSCTTCHR